jgi:hypothetical protein
MWIVTRNKKKYKTAFLFRFYLIIDKVSQILVWISLFYVWISPVLNFLGLQSKQKLLFCLDFPDFGLDFS